MRLFETADYSFIPNRTKGYIFSGVLIALSLLSLSTRGLELGIDFLGGMEFVVESPQELDALELRQALGQALGQEPEVKRYGQQGWLVRTSVEGEITQVQHTVMGAVADRYPEAELNLVSTNVVGPRFAEDLKRGAIWAVLGSLLVIFVYILIRFEWRFGLGAVAALFHDVTITLGVFSFFHGWLGFSLQIDQSIIAAFLTIVGYSLNDTVVIFDRIREYANLFKGEAYPDLVNRSINTTLSRTVVTSGTTLIVVTTLFIFGGEVLRGFAFALIIGVMIGTYSSIFIASPVVVELHERVVGDKRRTAGA